MKTAIKTCVLLVLLAPAAILSGQEVIEEIEKIEVITDVTGGGSDWESDNWATVERGINVLKPRMLRKNSLLFLVEHRTRKQPDSDSFHDLAGFDAGGLKIGLGLRYAPLDNLEMGFYRLNSQSEFFDTWEFDLKYRLLSQRSHGIDLAARTGVSWFSQGGIEDASGFFGQLLAGGKIGRHLRLGSGVLLHTESSSELKSTVDDEYSLALLSFIPAIVSGLGMASTHTSASSEFVERMLLHRNLNIAAGVVLLSALVVRIKFGLVVGGKTRLVYLALVLAAAGLMGYGSHLGDEIVWGEGFLPVPF